MYIEPTGDRIFAQRIEREAVTAGGLVLPETTEQTNKLNEAAVLLVGPRVATVKPGDHVLIGQYAGTDVSLDNEPFLVLREEEVLGIVRQDEKEEGA